MKKSKRITMATFAYCADKVPKLDGVITETLSIMTGGAIVHIRKFREGSDVTLNNYSVDAKTAARFLHSLDRKYKLYKWKSGYSKNDLAASIKKHLDLPAAGAGRYWSLVIKRGESGEEEMLVGRDEPPHAKAIRKSVLKLAKFDPIPRIFET